MPEIMTLKELCTYLRISPATAYRMLYKHQLPGFQVGTNPRTGVWRFERQQIDRWMETRQQRQGKEA
jgi:excisionase family DNA binding protein